MKFHYKNGQKLFWDKVGSEYLEGTVKEKFMGGSNVCYNLEQEDGTTFGAFPCHLATTIAELKARERLNPTIVWLTASSLNLTAKQKSNLIDQSIMGSDGVDVPEIITEIPLFMESQEVYIKPGYYCAEPDEPIKYTVYDWEFDEQTNEFIYRILSTVENEYGRPPLLFHEESSLITGQSEGV